MIQKAINQLLTYTAAATNLMKNSFGSKAEAPQVEPPQAEPSTQGATQPEQPTLPSPSQPLQLSGPTFGGYLPAPTIKENQRSIKASKNKQSPMRYKRLITNEYQQKKQFDKFKELVSKKKGVENG